MPIYEVQHSYPLSPSQKSSLAEHITTLHSTTFLTPSIFVHVNFQSRNASERNYFLAGKPCTTSINRIIAMVRTGPTRSVEDFDKLAAEIEEKWKDVVSGEKMEPTEGMSEEEKKKKVGKREGELNDTEIESKAKKLIVVAFYSMVGIRENGHVVPKAGEESSWYKSLRPEFVRRAEQENDELYKDLIDEVENRREDLKKAYLG